MFDALGVPAEILPPLVRPGTQIGVVGASAAEETGLAAGTPVVAGATDGCAALTLVLRGKQCSRTPP